MSISQIEIPSLDTILPQNLTSHYSFDNNQNQNQNQNRIKSYQSKQSIEQTPKVINTSTHQHRNQIQTNQRHYQENQKLQTNQHTPTTEQADNEHQHDIGNIFATNLLPIKKPNLNKICSKILVAGFAPCFFLVHHWICRRV